MTPGDVLGHESMGIVEEVGSEITHVSAGDRVVMPFQISCGHCYMCDTGLQTQCETTQVRDYKSGAALFGYSSLYGAVPGGQAEFLRVPQAQNTAIKVPEGPSDERFVYLSDVLPTAWQGVEYAGIPDGGTVVVLGLGPIGDMATRIAAYRGHRVIGVDLGPERLARVRPRGNEVLDIGALGDDIGDAIRELTDGRGPDSVIDAVGMEAHGGTGRQARARRRRPPAGFPGPQGDADGRHRPTRSASGRHRHRPARRHDLAQRGLRRHGRSAADAGHVRQADPVPDGSGERPAVGAADPSAC